jgi:hypothetical protein
MDTNPNPRTVVVLSDDSVKALADALQSGDAASQNFTRLIAPFLGGFTLATIPTLAASSNVMQPWRDVALALLVIATGLLLAGFQMTIGSLANIESQLRSILAFGGVGAIALAIVVIIVFSTKAVTEWVVVGLALAVLILSVFVPIALRISVNIKHARPMDTLRAFVSGRP